MLKVENISKTFRTRQGEVHAVKGVGLDVKPGEFCVLLGPSGAGKSTVLRMINGMTAPSAGAISVNGQCMTRKNRRDIQSLIGTIHQQFFLVPRLSVLDNVLSGTLPNLGLLRSLLKLFPQDDRRRACDLLHQVELEESQLYQKAGKLSGGQQQRVAIARAFIRKPELVLADEPVASLDPSISRGILRLLFRASRETGATVLCSLHQVDLACEFADRIVAMRKGELVFDGQAEELTKDILARIYDGASTASKPENFGSAPTTSSDSMEVATV